MPQHGGQIATVPAPNTQPIQFEITPLSSNQMIEADRVLHAAKPPALTEAVSRPGTVGSVQTHAGYDYDDPAYVAERDRLIPRRNAMICLFGCPALQETTPGGTLDEKINTILAEIPSVIVSWLSGELENHAMLAGVGEEAVASFFSEGSDGSKSSKNTNGRSRAKKRGQH